MRVRTIGQSHDQLDFEEIVVIARNDGTVVRLGDIAQVCDAFQNSDLILRHQGRPAVFVEVYRAEGEQVMDVAQAVHEHIANVIAPSLPDGVGITIWNDDSQTYSERADILRKKGLMGLVLVFVALACFSRYGSLCGSSPAWSPRALGNWPEPVSRTHRSSSPCDTNVFVPVR